MPSNPIEQYETLEAIIDQYGLAITLGAIAEICHDKADHIAENWQDVRLAEQWDLAGRRTRELAASVAIAKVSPRNRL